MNDISNQIIEEVLIPRYENRAKCPEFELNTGRCRIKTKLSRPKIEYSGNTKGGRGQPKVYYNFSSPTDCPYLYTGEECIYFDCAIYQAYKLHKCITKRDLNEAVGIISRKVFEEYGTNPRKLSADNIFKTIKTIKPSITSELLGAFKVWLKINFDCIDNDGRIYLKLE